jgi:hypothetical protein
MPKSTHTIRNGIIAGLSVMFIGAIASGAVKHFTKIIPSIGSFFVHILHFMNSDVTMKMWLLFLLILFILPTIYGIIRGFAKKRELTHYDYTEDTFFGIKWIWRHDASNSRITDLFCFCPKDDTILVQGPNRDYFNPRNVFSTNLICESCNSTFGPFEGTFEDLMQMVKRQIDRKIRTEEYKQILTNRLGT